MPIGAAINGFGRIGQQVYRAIRKHYPNQIRVVAVNDVGRPEMMTHLDLVKHDNSHGCSPGGVRKATAGFVADGADVRVLAQLDPRRLPWEALGVDVVIEATGLIRDASTARAHIDRGKEWGYCVRVADLVAYVSGERRASHREHHESTWAH